MKQGHVSVVMLLAGMMALVPALGVPSEILLQDTLKSILVSFFTLTATMLFFLQATGKGRTIALHWLQLLPLSLMIFALGSMVWSHTYLGGVEAIRWFLFSLILLLAANTISIDNMPRLAWGIHIGAAFASLWAALQFWMDFQFFAQGPNPASTFVNRNFFAEFVVCTLPFSAYLLMRVKDKTSVFFLVFSLAFNVVALMMTGTRAALLGLLMLAILIPAVLIWQRKHFASKGWTFSHAVAATMLGMAAVFTLGSIPTGNPKLISEIGPGNALSRAFVRTVSLTNPGEYQDGSFSIRAIMWKATGRMIGANPLLGVGAGAWEVEVPRYQAAGSDLETDYYAHNEILQLVAEYGVVGVVFLFSLICYLCWSAHKTWRAANLEGTGEAPLRALLLSSLLVFLLVSNAGFAWRMASTGALFALCLGGLVASDIRLSLEKRLVLKIQRIHQLASGILVSLTGACLVLAIYISQRAMECEAKLVEAIKIALTITQSGRPNDPGWRKQKSDMLQLVREGVAINPHYRKLTPVVADSLARWGDWKNAAWVWESVLASRPNVVAILANLTRANLQVGDVEKANDYFQKAKLLQPAAPALQTLEVLLLSRMEKFDEAAKRAKDLLQSNRFDYDLVRTAYFLGMRNRDPDLAVHALQVRIKTWPEQAIDGWLKLGQIYDTPEGRDRERAIASYRAALEAASPSQKSAVLAMIPPAYHPKIQ